MYSLRLMSGLPHNMNHLSTVKRSTGSRSSPNKKKSSVTPPRSSTPAPRPKNPKRRSKAPSSNDVAKICGLVDPFCSHAMGSKYPDASSVKTLPFTVQFEQILSSDAEGELGALLAPQVGFSPVSTTSVVGTVMTQTAFPAAPVPVLSGAQKYRIVSCGVILKSIAPLLTASGMISVRSIPSEVGTNLTLITGNSYGVSQVKNIPLVDLTDTGIIFEHSSQIPTAFYPIETSALVADWLAPGFTPVTVYGQGLPASTSCIHLQFVMHLEYFFDDGSALALATTPAPQPQPWLTDTSTKLTAHLGNYFAESSSKLSTYIENYALTQLKNFLGNSVSYVAPLLLGI